MTPPGSGLQAAAACCRGRSRPLCRWPQQPSSRDWCRWRSRKPSLEEFSTAAGRDTPSRRRDLRSACRSGRGTRCEKGLRRGHRRDRAAPAARAPAGPPPRCSRYAMACASERRLWVAMAGTRRIAGVDQPAREPLEAGIGLALLHPHRRLRELAERRSPSRGPSTRPSRA